MSDFLPARLLVLVTWAVAFLALTGLGAGLRRAAGLRRGLEHRTDDFWLGQAVLLLLLQAGHLFLPVADGMRLLILGAGAAGLYVDRRGLLTWLRHQKTKPLLAILVFAALFAHTLCGPPDLPDTGGYHMTAIRWAREHPLVMGLANLYGRLGFNSSHFLYGAWLEVGPLEGRAHHVANGLLLLVLIGQLAGRALRFCRSPRARLSDSVALFLLTGAVGALARDGTHSCGTDLPLLVGGSVLTVWLATVLENHRPRRDRRLAAFGVVVVGASLVTIKFSAVVFALAAALIVFLRWRELRPARREVVLAAALAVAMAGLWAGRGVAQSGYLAFPVTTTAIDVTWQVPDEIAAGYEGSVGSWVKRPLEAGERAGASADLAPWATRLLRRRFEFLIPALLGLAGVIATAFSFRAAGSRLLLLLPPVTALVFWFLTAPDPRLAGAALWAFFAVGLSLALSPWVRTRRGLRIAMLLLALAPTALPLRYVRWNPPRGPLGFASYPAPPMQEFRCDSGLVVFVPKAGGDCWNAPLPCTPRPDRRLRLREPDRLRSGFKVQAPR